MCEHNIVLRKGNGLIVNMSDSGLGFWVFDCTSTRPRGYKTFFMLSSTETKICPANEC